MDVTPELKTKLIDIGELIWKSYITSNYSACLFKIKSDSIVELIDTSFNDIIKLRFESYELWKNKDFKFTALVYKSSSINSITLNTRDFYVVEIEHEELTGTFYLFIPIDRNWDVKKIEVGYVDRN
ncbi:MAG TPA: hypothetical protein DIW31_04910 [Bacteroidales bacterium]|nr:hypothetical protein [Bacteroidales bacterium]